MSRVFRPIAVLLMLGFSSAALAQKSSGYMDLEEMSGVGPRLVVVRVMFSGTDATCPRQTGMIRISSNGALTDILALLKDNSPGYQMNPTAAPDSFTYRRRIETDSCRIDVDIGEQQQKNGEWKPLIYRYARGLEAIREDTRKVDDLPALSPAKREAYDRADREQLHAGNLRQGVTATITSGTRFEGIDNCFEAVGTYLIDQNGVTMLFATDLGGELNRFLIKRLDSDADHSTLFLSRGSCRVGFTVSASIFQEGAWSPLPIAPSVLSK